MCASCYGRPVNGNTCSVSIICWATGKFNIGFVCYNSVVSGAVDKTGQVSISVVVVDNWSTVGQEVASYKFKEVVVILVGFD